MKKEEVIRRYGKEEYKKRLKRNTKEAIIAQRGEAAYKERLERRSKEAIIERYGEEGYKKRLKKNTKEAYITWYGEEAYEQMLERNRARYKANPESYRQKSQMWRVTHPEEVRALSDEAGRKGGKYYERNLEANKKGLRGERNIIRTRHRHEFREIKDTLAVEVELHHEWIGDTAEYRGMAFVEKVAHRNGIIDVILLLDGEITIYDFT